MCHFSLVDGEGPAAEGSHVECQRIDALVDTLRVLLRGWSASNVLLLDDAAEAEFGEPVPRVYFRDRVVAHGEVPTSWARVKVRGILVLAHGEEALYSSGANHARGVGEHVPGRSAGDFD